MSRADRYAVVLQQLDALIEEAPGAVTAMASTAALLNDSFEHFFWTGFYLPDPAGSGDLVVGPYQGPLACMRLPAGRGLCGVAARTGETQLVPDVDALEDHIACDARSRSEIVVPLRDRERLVAVLDVDSDRLDAFDDADREGLQAVALRLAKLLGR